MTDLTRNIRVRIRNLAGGSAHGLIAVPEIENDSTKDAIRKLQIQIFTLTEVITDLHNELEKLRRG